MYIYKCTMCLYYKYLHPHKYTVCGIFVLIMNHKVMPTPFTSYFPPGIPLLCQLLPGTELLLWLQCTFWPQGDCGLLWVTVSSECLYMTSLWSVQCKWKCFHCDNLTLTSNKLPGKVCNLCWNISCTCYIYNLA